MGSDPHRPASWGEKQFYEWLGGQRERRDPVGSFANDAWQDADFPREVSSVQDLVDYMHGRGAREDAVEAAKEAWTEFGAAAEDYVHPDNIVDWDGLDEERR